MYQHSTFLFFYFVYLVSLVIEWFAFAVGEQSFWSEYIIYWPPPRKIGHDYYQKLQYVFKNQKGY